MTKQELLDAIAVAVDTDTTDDVPETAITARLLLQSQVVRRGMFSRSNEYIEHCMRDVRLSIVKTLDRMLYGDARRQLHAIKRDLLRQLDYSSESLDLIDECNKLMEILNLSD